MAGLGPHHPGITYDFVSACRQPSKFVLVGSLSFVLLLMSVSVVCSQSRGFCAAAACPVSACCPHALLCCCPLATVHAGSSLKFVLAGSVLFMLLLLSVSVVSNQSRGCCAAVARPISACCLHCMRCLCCRSLATVHAGSSSFSYVSVCALFVVWCGSV